MMFKKIGVIFLFLLLFSLFIATISAVTVNDIEFNIPKEYQGGENKTNGYQLENIFGIFCIDDNKPQTIGFWAGESEYSENLEIGNHPVRYYYSYNEYVNDNMSHAFFASGNSFYEIFWVGNEISPDIEKLIKDTPDSNIDSESFYSSVDDSIDIYIKDKDRSYYDDLYDDYNSRNTPRDRSSKSDNNKFRETLITYSHHFPKFVLNL